MKRLQFPQERFVRLFRLFILSKVPPSAQPGRRPASAYKVSGISPIPQPKVFLSDHAKSVSIPTSFYRQSQGEIPENKGREFGNTHGSFCRYKLYFLFIHNNFDLNILIHYKCTIFFGIMQGIRQLFYKKTRNTAKTSANRIYLSRQTSGHRIFVM